MLPLIQQMQADLRSGALAPVVFAEDLEHVQKWLRSAGGFWRDADVFAECGEAER